MYVAEPNENAIFVFIIQANQFVDSSPAIVIKGDKTLLDNPMHIAVDVHGYLYVVNRPPHNNAFRGAYINIYDPGTEGNTGPARRIFAGEEFDSWLVDGYGIAVDQDGQIFVSDLSGILLFHADANGHALPRQFAGDRNSLGTPAGLAVR